jgi:hypothetical protein
MFPWSKSPISEGQPAVAGAARVATAPEEMPILSPTPPRFREIMEVHA